MTRTLRALAVLAVLVPGAVPATAADWRSELAAWRSQRETDLAAEDGWLSLAGLYWLPEHGTLTFGSGPGVDVPLRPPAPGRAGQLRLRGGTVEVRLEPGVDAGAGAGPASRWRSLRTDLDGEPDRLRFGGQRLHVIARGDRFGVRLVDDEAETRTRFQGLDWYPPKDEWRIRARFVAHAEPRKLRIPTVTGRIREQQSPGHAVFAVGGREVRLHPVLSDSEEGERLFFIFRDATSGRDTYGAGRFLYAALPEAGSVELDFNRAYSPPCAFTPYATCPLPPPENRLDVAIDAGEKDPHLLH